jgi:hypothetical protein
MSNRPDQETYDPLYADRRNFYMVEKWTRDGTKVDSLLYAGNSLGRARSIFECAIKTPPTDQIDQPPADARVRSVASASTQKRQIIAVAAVGGFSCGLSERL